MSDSNKRKLEMLALLVAVISGIGAFFGAFVLLPYRMQAAEKAIEAVQTERKTDRELLIRVDVRTERMEKALDRIAK